MSGKKEERGGKENERERERDRKGQVRRNERGNATKRKREMEGKGRVSYIVLYIHIHTHIHTQLISFARVNCLNYYEAPSTLNDYTRQFPKHSHTAHTHTHTCSSQSYAEAVQEVKLSESATKDTNVVHLV